MNNTNKSEPNVVRYQTDSREFEYARFWDNRNFEDRAERILLKSWLGYYPKAAKWLVDIGGSFGRLIPVYSRVFKQIAILDYATNEFHLAKASADKHKVDVQLIAANAYHLPLADDSQTAIIAIRIVHHLEDPASFFAEISRVLAKNGLAIIEVSNKNHLKLWLRSVAKLNFKDWRSSWVDIGSSGLQDDGVFTLIRSYKPAYVESLMLAQDLEIKKKCSVSWLRQTPLARLPKSVTNLIEWLCQQVSPLAMVAPSNWYMLSKDKACIDKK